MGDAQTNLNQNPEKYILYYANVAQADSTVYSTDLSDVCSIYFDSSENVQITGWLIGGYAAPTISTLLGYDFPTVLAFFNNFYTVPAAIAVTQYYPISTANLASVRADSSMMGYVVFDTTIQEERIFNGTSWTPFSPDSYLLLAGGTMSGAIAMGSNNLTGVGTINSHTADNLVTNTGTSASGNVANFSGTSGKLITDSGASLSQYLPLVGGTMSGSLNMGSNAITGASTVYQTTPSAITAWTSGSTATSLTASTSAVIGVTGFTQILNPNSDFTLGTGTGQCKYTGSSTRYFRVSINFGVSVPAVLTTQTLTIFVTKNSPGSAAGSRAVFSVTLAGATAFTGQLSDIVQLANNDTIQLAALYTATASATFSNVNYAISQI